MNLTKQFFKYVSQNIFGLIGTSCYILADTYFIAQAAGTDGVTLLNLCLPMYNLIFAFGSMIGLGAATRYAILQAQGEARAQRLFPPPSTAPACSPSRSCWRARSARARSCSSWAAMRTSWRWA